MPTLAFWNVNRNATTENVVGLAREWDVDILVLAENQIPLLELIQALNKAEERLYFPDRGESNYLTILTRFQPELSSLVRDHFSVSIRHYRLPLGESFLVVAAHLASKLWKKTEDQIFVATRFADLIREAEESVGHARTIVIGDLNMNPFEAGLVAAGALHGVMDRRIASEGFRTISGENYPFFYNPMWSFLGDRGPAPPGTYFYNSGTEVNYFWNAFDQVLIRPVLLDALPPDGVSIVAEIQGKSLLTAQGRPNRRQVSDHLPIVCRMTEI